MKTFKDLIFKTHENSYGFDTHAVLFFENNYGVSVIAGKMAYSNENKPYELAIILKTDDGFDICYNTDISDDVIGYLTSDEVTEYMLRVQKLK